MELTINWFGYWHTADIKQALFPIFSSFVVIAAAEIGDKSQLVCMVLASKHRSAPVFWGAVSAFATLNTLAVLFGAALAQWLPEYLLAACVALMFAGFGLHAIFANAEEEQEEVVEISRRGMFLTTLTLITVAEFGDKTQLAVAALSSTAEPWAVWTGATLALALTSGLGILAGKTLLKRMRLSLLKKISGIIFIVLALSAAYRALISLPTWVWDKICFSAFV
ncbi:TMEM165/GDT1 family protein [Methylomonas rhizoryzae]|uniref:TMEM165/GDT1 family protein n=1 Tax=Methylomonas rhizoryzae TaxID=2608981 RepID=UPI001232C0EB|nr:TMEM165/GDT1 family protein [Methylomonas rhizoryzae]